MMIPAVVLAVLFVSPVFSLPLTTQEFIATGAQDLQYAVVGNKGFNNPQAATTPEKSQIEGVFQTPTGTSDGSFVESLATKTGFEGISSGKPARQDYSESGQRVEPVIIRGTQVQYSGLETISQAQQTGVQVPSAAGPQDSNSPVPKGENVPASVDQKQPQQSDNPLLLPIQPLTVIPFNPSGGILEPVIVPGEAVTAGRLIIMAMKPIQQRNFQEVSTAPQKQVPHQQVGQAVAYSSEQGQTDVTAFGQQVQKEEIQRGGQAQTPVQQQPNQVQLVREQVPQNPEVLQQAVEQVPNYVPAQGVEPSPQTYSVQPVQPVVSEYVQKQIPQQSTGYSLGQTQVVESTVQQQQPHYVQQNAEKQGVVQQAGFDSVPQQVQTLYQQHSNPVAVEGLQSQQPYQAGQFVEKRISEPGYQQQSAEGQTAYQQSSYVPVQNQPSNQQVYSVQPESQQSYILVEPQPVQQKISGGQSGYQESYIPVQTQQTIYQSGEKQLPYQQPVQGAQYVQILPQESNPQQQVSSVQPLAGVPTEAQVPNRSVQPETPEYVPQQKTLEEQPSRVVDVQTQQVVNYAEPIYNFGDKLPQNAAVQQNTAFTSCQQ